MNLSSEIRHFVRVQVEAAFAFPLRRKRGGSDIPEYQCNNVSIGVESCLVLRHPTRSGRSKVSGIKDGTYPNIEFDILISDGFDVEPDRRDCRDRLVEFELVQYCYRCQHRSGSWCDLVISGRKRGAGEEKR